MIKNDNGKETVIGTDELRGKTIEEALKHKPMQYIILDNKTVEYACIISGGVKEAAD